MVSRQLAPRKIAPQIIALWMIAPGMLLPDINPKDNCPLKIFPQKLSPRTIASRMICRLHICLSDKRSRRKLNPPPRKIVPRINYTRDIFSTAIKNRSTLIDSWSLLFFFFVFLVFPLISV